MNKKGQTMGAILLVFITIIVGVILFQVVAQQVGDTTTTRTLSNLTLGTQTNGTTYYITGYRNIADAIVVGNGSVPVTLASGNYTLTNNVINPTTGELSVSILPASEYTNTGWNISGTAQETDYISSSGARSIAALIPLFFALGVAVVALIPTTRSKILSMIGK